MADYWPFITFAIIFLSVPLQFYLSPKSSELKYHLTMFVDELRVKLLPISNYFHGSTPEEGLSQDAAEEMIDSLVEGSGVSLSDGHFASSEEPRDPRPPHVKFRVGQVFRHKKFRYRAVIIGWDETAKVPEWWIKDILRNKKEWSERPNYLALIDTRDKAIPQIGYVIEENIEPVTDVKIIHPFLEKYFEGFKNRRYILRPWLQRIYPFDH